MKIVKCPVCGNINQFEEKYHPHILNNKEDLICYNCLLEAPYCDFKDMTDEFKGNFFDERV